MESVKKYYHYSDYNFNKFSIEKLGQNLGDFTFGFGFYFYKNKPDKVDTQLYGDYEYEVELDIKRTLTFDAAMYRLFPLSFRDINNRDVLLRRGKDITNYAISLGYDSIQNKHQMVVFDANKIKILSKRLITKKSMSNLKQLNNELKQAIREANGEEYTFADWFGQDLTGQTYKGNINCNKVRLTSLKGAPEKVIGNFECDHNNLVTLAYAPSIIYGNFSCYANMLTSLEGSPQVVDGYFNCSSNNLTTLQGCPKEVSADFWCAENQLTNLIKKVVFGGSQVLHTA